MARGNQTRAGDLTGKMKAELQQQHADEIAEKAKNTAMATASAAAETKETVDLEPRQEPVQERVVGEVAVSQDVDVREEIVKFRVNETLEQVTIGHGNHYDFEEGREYRAPKRIYDHLEEKGLIWH